MIHYSDYSSQPDVKLACGRWTIPSWNTNSNITPGIYLEDAGELYTFEHVEKVTCPACILYIRNKMTVLNETSDCSCHGTSKPEVSYTIDDVTDDSIFEALESGLVDHMTASAARRGNKRARQKVADAMNTGLPPGVRVITPPSFEP